jgi:hypothetical protein
MRQERPGDPALYARGIEPFNEALRPGTLQHSVSDPSIIPDRPYGSIPPQNGKVFMGPGTAGTRLYGQGHQLVKSRGFCHLSKVAEWCHTGTQDFLELAIRGRHLVGFDLGEHFLNVNIYYEIT